MLFKESKLVVTKKDFIWSSKEFSLYFLIIFTLLTMASCTSDETEKYCKGLKRFTKRQLDFCLRSPEVVKILESGLKDGINQCQDRFKNNSVTRWNCTSIASDGWRNSLFNVPMTTGSKEGAIMHAFAAAGMLHSLAQKCIDQELPGCSPRVPQRCRQQSGTKPTSQLCIYVDWSLPLSHLFLFFNPKKTLSFKKGITSRINEHNRAVGAVAVMKNTKRSCECIVSTDVYPSCSRGSICRENLPSLEDIGRDLMATYSNHAYRLVNNRASSDAKKPQASQSQVLNVLNFLILDDNGVLRKPLTNELVYWKTSPTYCDKSTTFHWNGIGGRRCRPRSGTQDDCSRLCCGYGYIILTERTRSCRVIPSSIFSVKCTTGFEYRFYCKYKWMVQKTTDKR